MFANMMKTALPVLLVVALASGAVIPPIEKATGVEKGAKVNDGESKAYIVSNNNKNHHHHHHHHMDC